MPEFSEFRYAPFEFRQTDDGLGVVEGVLLRDGDKATFPWGTEEFLPGALGDVSGKLIKANRQHDRGETVGTYRQRDVACNSRGWRTSGGSNYP